jgi:hypothetical protein
MLLRTLAVPWFGVQIGAAVSLAIAWPPWVAIAIAKPPGVVQVARARASRLADASAEQNEAIDVARASLPFLAVAFAVPPSVAVAAALLATDASAVAVPASPSALALLLFPAFALLVAPLSAVASESLFPVAIESAEPPLSTPDSALLACDAFAFALPEVVTSALHVLPSAPVLETGPELETHVAPLPASALPALSTKSSTHAIANRVNSPLLIIRRLPLKL